MTCKCISIEATEGPDYNMTAGARLTAINPDCPEHGTNRLMRINETFSRKDMGAYVQVYQRPSERGPKLDMNFFEGVRTLGEAKILYAILGEAIACAEGKKVLK